jgi:5-formyltetrahydrofolate cyclo-ligase
VRRRALVARRAASKRHGLAAAEAVADRFLSALGATVAGRLVAGYWPMADELDPRPLLAALGTRLALPMVSGDALLFRAWKLGDPLGAGARGTQHPTQGATVLPDVVIAPLIAFDRFGHRLGRGGGFYDRAIAMLRARGKPLVVGIGFDVQEVPAIPVGEGDQHLDWIVTETRAIKAP